MCVVFSEFSPTSLDAWALAEFNKLSQTVRSAYDAYQFQKATSAIYNFCNDTMSAIYLAAVKDRLYCDQADSPRRRRTQSALWDICDGLCRLLAPIIPHTADEAYRELRGVTNQDKSDTTCVHTARFVESFPVECDPAWDDLMQARDAALKAMEQVRAKGDLENPLDCGLVFPDPNGTLAKFDTDDLADLLGVSRASVDASVGEIRIEDLRDQPMCERSRKRDASVKQRSDGGMLSDRDAAAVGVA
ncbi:MAG: class I tRNA ligase family protein, partial [Phycisphaerales bacterium JB050]